MKISKIVQDDCNERLDLALTPWPDYPAIEMQVILSAILDSPREDGFIARDKHGTAIAFMNLSLRSDYVPGTMHRTVAYVEGIYVKDKYHKQGVGTALIQTGQRWGSDHGCLEIASDALIENIASHEFHTKIGFREVE